MNKCSYQGRTRVKICGFTRVDDAVQAAHLGVDAIGLVFFPPSSRNVDTTMACDIVAQLPVFVSVVALFVDESASRIDEVLDAVRIDLIQFHGAESPVTCRQFGVPYMKALQMGDGIDVKRIADQYSDARGLLLDAFHADEKGGTGQCFDWSRVPKQCDLPIILAGGLDSSNVKDALRIAKPYAVDVSSGVEISKGIKDKSIMSEFINEVQKFDHTRK